MSKLQQRLEQANNYIIPFGQHKGKKLALLVKEDWEYLQKILNGTASKHYELKKHIQTIMYGGLWGINEAIQKD